MGGITIGLPLLNNLSWCEQNETGVCEQNENNALGLLSDRVIPVISSVASAEDRALRGRNLSAD